MLVAHSVYCSLQERLSASMHISSDDIFNSRSSFHESITKERKKSNLRLGRVKTAYNAMQENKHSVSSCVRSNRFRLLLSWGI